MTSPRSAYSLWAAGTAGGTQRGASTTAGGGGTSGSGRWPGRRTRSTICAPVAASRQIRRRRTTRPSRTPTTRSTRCRRYLAPVAYRSCCPSRRVSTRIPATPGTTCAPSSRTAAYTRRRPPAWSAPGLRTPLLADRPDVLVFQTEPLAADVEVTGSIEVNLWVSSSAVDTDFTVRLLDIYPSSEDYPDGYHLNLGDSIIRARYRATASTALR